MPTPTQLSIATAAVQRLTKEQQQYHNELADQQARVAKLEAEMAAHNPDLDENASYRLTQEKQAIAETKAMVPHLRARIAAAVAKLEEALALAESSPSADDDSGGRAKAGEALALGRGALGAAAGEE